MPLILTWLSSVPIVTASSVSIAAESSQAAAISVVHARAMTPRIIDATQSADLFGWFRTVNRKPKLWRAEARLTAAACCLPVRAPV